MNDRQHSMISELEQQLALLKLTIFQQNYQAVAEKCEKEKRSYIEYLQELVGYESEHRTQKRIQSLIKSAKLPRDKLLSDFDMTRIPGLAPSQIKRLGEGEFIDRYANILIFGNPGTGKTHLCIGLAKEWCLLGRKVYFVTAASLVQSLLQAKGELKLEQYIKKLDRYEILIIDDISYVPFKREETDVLFTLLAARYEMRSIVITSNLPFSKWNTIFKDDMTTAAAIDRLVHHASILELNTSSYRTEQAKIAQGVTVTQDDSLVKKETEEKEDGNDKIA